MESMRDVGLCNEVDYIWYGSPISYQGTNVEKVGKFHVTCSFGEEADKCGGPLCDGLTFTAWGDILRKPDVIFIGYPVNVTTDASCNKVLYGIEEGKKSAGRKSATPKATTSGSYGYDDTPLYQGQGDIETGFFTVTSRHHKVNVKTGHFQLTYYSGTDLTPVEKMPTDANWVAVSSDIKLSFYKSESY